LANSSGRAPRRFRPLSWLFKEQIEIRKEMQRTINKSYKEKLAREGI